MMRVPHVYRMCTACVPGEEVDLRTGAAERVSDVVAIPLHSSGASTRLSDSSVPPQRSSEQQVGAWRRCTAAYRCTPACI